MLLPNAIVVAYMLATVCPVQTIPSRLVAMTEPQVMKVARFTLPVGSKGDDSAAYQNIQQLNGSATFNTKASSIDPYTLQDGLKKIFKLALRRRDFYPGMFILNDELPQGQDATQANPYNFNLYLRRTAGAVGTNAKLDAYSDCVGFSNTTNHTTESACDFSGGNYVWYRKSSLVNGSLVTTTTYHAMQQASQS